jgi:hypothetical protein
MIVLGVGALALFLARHYHSLWAATAILATLAVLSIIGYLILLARISRIALARRDVLTTELARA